MEVGDLVLQGDDHRDHDLYLLEGSSGCGCLLAAPSALVAASRAALAELPSAAAAAGMGRLEPHHPRPRPPPGHPRPRPRTQRPPLLQPLLGPLPLP